MMTRLAGVYIALLGDVVSEAGDRAGQGCSVGVVTARCVRSFQKLVASKQAAVDRSLIAARTIIFSLGGDSLAIITRTFPFND